MITTDKIKLGLAILLLLAGVVAFHQLAEHAAIVRVLAVLVGAGAAAAVAWTSAPGKEFLAFGKEAVAETRKVVWPSRKETLQTTGVVLVLVVVVALFMWIVDAGLMWVVQLLLGQGA